MDKKRLAICAIFENEARLLPEWLAYHHLVGVDHFVLYDNGSSDDSVQAIHSSPVAEHATLIRWPQRPGRIAAYRHFVDIFAPGFEWAAFIDPGQFLLPLNSRSVMDTLEWLSSAAGALVHRRVFAPGQAAPGLVIETCNRRAPDDFPANSHVRVIARCSELLDVTQQPHEFRFNRPVFNTAGHLAPNRAVQSPACFQNLVINQYCIAPSAEALAKLLDDRADAPQSVDAGVLAALSQQEDDAIRVFVPAVRELLRLEPAGAATIDAANVAVPAEEPIVAATMDAAVTPAEEPVVAAATDAAVAPAEQPMVAATTDAPAAPAEEPVVAATLLAVDFAPPAQPVPADVASGWMAAGSDGQARTGGLALVFRDRSRPGEHWLAALRGAAADAIDPAFLMDEFGRIRDFPNDAEARMACDAALAEGYGHRR